MSNKKIRGFTLYTAGSSNSVTAGNQTTITAGASNSFAGAGMSSYATLSNATYVFGTYLEAVAGNTVTFTNGPTLNMTNGDSFSSNTTSRQQASESYEIAAGIGEGDDAIWKKITRCMYLVKALIVLQGAANAAVASGLDMKEDYVENKDGQKNAIKDAIGIGAANAVAAAVTFRAIRSIASKAKDMRHVGTVKVSNTGVEIDGEFAGNTSALNLKSEEVVLERKPRGEGLQPSSVTFKDNSTKLAVGPANVALTPTTAAMTVNQTSVQLTETGFVVKATEENAQLQVNGMGITAAGTMIRLG